MQLTRERRDTLPDKDNLKHNRIALISGLADAFQDNGIPAQAVSANAKIGNAEISNLVALRLGEQEHYVDIDGNVGWDDILAHALSRPQVKVDAQTPATLTQRSFTSQQSRQALWPHECDHLERWREHDAALIVATYIELATVVRTHSPTKNRL